MFLTHLKNAIDRIANDNFNTKADPNLHIICAHVFSQFEHISNQWAFPELYLSKGEGESVNSVLLVWISFRGVIALDLEVGASPLISCSGERIATLYEAPLTGDTKLSNDHLDLLR